MTILSTDTKLQMVMIQKELQKSQGLALGSGETSHHHSNAMTIFITRSNHVHLDLFSNDNGQPFFNLGFLFQGLKVSLRIEIVELTKVLTYYTTNSNIS